MITSCAKIVAGAGLAYLKSVSRFLHFTIMSKVKYLRSFPQYFEAGEETPKKLQQRLVTRSFLDIVYAQTK